MKYAQRIISIAIATAFCASMCACSHSTEPDNGINTNIEQSSDIEVISSNNDNSQDVSTDSSDTESTASSDENDTEVAVTSGSVDETDATSIVCSGSGATVSGGSAITEQGLIKITVAGSYILSGTFNGQIRVAAGDADKVKLILNGFNGVNTDDSVIYVESADKVTIKAQGGSTNIIKDSDTSVESDSDTRGKAAIYSKASLEFSGAGALDVSSSYKHAVATTKKLTVSNGNLNITAADSGLKGNNSVVITGGTISIDSKGDGIKTEETEDTEKGFVNISGGNITINTEGDAIRATISCEISDGTIDIVTTGSDSASVSSGMGNRGGKGGRWGWEQAPAESQTSSEDDTSSKGIKVGCDEVGTSATLQITGGTIKISSTGHCVHSTGDITVDGTANLTLSSNQKGIQAHNVLYVKGGTVNVTKSTEGMESKNDMYISGGKVTVYASDDGLNVGNSGKTLYISGGVIDVTTSEGDTDTIDSNGDIKVSGGLLIVKSNSFSGRMSGTVDVDGRLNVTGGTIVSLGGISDMPDSGSTTGTIVMYNKSFSAGSYSISDKSGKEIASFTLTDSYGSAWISSESFVSGGAYAITKDGSDFLSWTQSNNTQNVG